MQIFLNLLKLVPNFPCAKAKRHLVSRENFVKVFKFRKFDFVRILNFVNVRIFSSVGPTCRCPLGLCLRRKLSAAFLLRSFPHRPSLSCSPQRFGSSTGSMSLLLFLSLTLFRAEPMAPAPLLLSSPSRFSPPSFLSQRRAKAAALLPPWAPPLLLLFSSVPRQLATAPLAAACPHRCRAALTGAARAPWCSPELLLSLWYKAAPSAPHCPVSRAIFLLSFGLT
jgi:hypothetical protein